MAKGGNEYLFYFQFGVTYGPDKIHSSISGLSSYLSHICRKRNKNLWLTHCGFSGEQGGFQGASTVAEESGKIGVDLVMGGIGVLDHSA